MRCFTLSLSIALASTALSSVAGEVCVQNGDDKELLFVSEARSGDRAVDRLAPGGKLCVADPNPAGGVVSVFESATEEEGCSRLVEPREGPRILLRYSSFDRCAWDDNVGGSTD